MDQPHSPIDATPISTLYRRPRTPLTLSFASAPAPDDSTAPASSSGYLSPRIQLPRSLKEPQSIVTFDLPPAGARRAASWKGDDPRAGGGVTWARGLRWARDVLEVAAWVLSLGGVTANAPLLDSSRRYYGSTMGVNVELLFATTLALASLPLLRLFNQPRVPGHPLSSLTTELAVLAILWTLTFAGAITLNATLPSLHSCAGFALCDQARAVQVFAWSSTGVLAASGAVVGVEAWRRGEWRSESGGEDHRRRGR
ncbi:hypothetical protein RQP46_010058 [Phenoliferia psychrophenolica]